MTAGMLRQSRGGDVDDEKAANCDAEKAAKKLCTAIEHNRRQQLIITALEQELIAIDIHIIEAQKEYEVIEKKLRILPIQYSMWSASYGQGGLKEQVQHLM